MLDVRRLRLLVELSQRGTLAAVAEALSYSPSSVSQQLSQLEREAGVPLLVQVGRRVQLTPQAELLVGHARAVLDRLEEAESDVARSLTAVGGTVRIAVFQSAAHAMVPQALTLLRGEHPALRVEVTEREPDVGLFEVVGARLRPRDRRAVPRAHPRPPRRPRPRAPGVRRDPARAAAASRWSRSAAGGDASRGHARCGQRPRRGIRHAVGARAAGHGIPRVGRAAVPRRRVRARRALRDRRPDGAHPAHPIGQRGRACCPTSCGRARRRA